MARLLLTFVFLVHLSSPFSLVSHASEDPHQQPINDASPPPVSAKCSDYTAVVHELDRAKTKLYDLEKSLSERDVILQDKLKIISSLQEEFERLKKTKGSDHDTIEKELGSKVVKLQDDINEAEVQLQKYKEKVQTLESESASQASKIKQLEKLVSEQKTKITKAERALRLAELTLAKVQKEVDEKDIELLKVNGGWLPPWIVTKSSDLKDAVLVFWTRYAQPRLDAAAVKVSGKASAAWKSSKPYVNDLKTNVQEKLSPLIIESIESFKYIVSPHVELARSKLVEGYGLLVNFVSPKLEVARAIIRPHLETVNKTCRPYIERIAGVLHPYYKQVRSITKPYRRKIFRVYRRFQTRITAYHNQLQISLKKYDVLAPLVTKEVVWILASGLLLLPILAVSVFFSSIRRSQRKPVKAMKIHGNHAQRKAKKLKQSEK